MTRGLLLRMAIATLALLAFGVAGMELGARRERARMQPGPTARLVDRETLFNAISPTTEQWREIEEILDRAQLRTDSIMFGLSRQVMGVTRDADAEIRALLTPSQRAVFESLDTRPMLPRRRSGPR